MRISYSSSLSFHRSFVSLVIDRQNCNVKKYLSFAMRKFLIPKSSSNNEKKRPSNDEAELVGKSTPPEDHPPAKKTNLDTPPLAQADDDDSNKSSEPVSKEMVDKDYEATDVSCVTTCKTVQKTNFKIVSWNVAGIRACIKKNGFKYIQSEDADVVCLQEVKCQRGELPKEVHITGYHEYWAPGIKPGYAGMGLYSKTKPISYKYGLGNQEYDSEGRLITVEFDKFYVVTAYVPNSGDGLKNLSKRLGWDAELKKWLKSLDEKKPVVLAGDLNVCHHEIDVAQPNLIDTRTACVSKEERDGMTALLSVGFVDSFRSLYPEKTEAFSYWSYSGNARSKNSGWRLDYFVVSERFMNCVRDSTIRSEIHGSDHCPIVLQLSI